MRLRAAVLLLLLGSPVRADERAFLEDRKGDAILHVEGREIVKGVLQVRTSDTVTLKLRFVNDRFAEIRDLRIEIDKTDWTEKRTTMQPPLKEGQGRLLTLEVEVEPWKSGTTSLPTLSLSYRLDENHPWKSVRWEGKTVEVIGPGDKDGTEVRGDLSIEPVPPAPPVPPFPVREVVLGAIFLVVGVGLLLWALRPRSVVREAADVRALRELARLRMSSGGAPGWLHARVSAIVRQYLEDRHGIQAPRQTTEELLQTVRKANILSDDQLSLLGELLAACDRVKFAATSPEAPECQEALSVATRFIAETAPVPGANQVSPAVVTK